MVKLTNCGESGYPSPGRGGLSNAGLQGILKTCRTCREDAGLRLDFSDGRKTGRHPWLKELHDSWATETWAMARAERLVTIPNAGGGYSSEILPDPDELYLLREQLGVAIDGLESVR